MKNDKKGKTPMISCKEFRACLSEYLDGEIIPDYRIEIDQHLRTCQRCRRIFVKTYTVTRNLHNLPRFRTSENFEEHLREHLQSGVSDWTLRLKEWRERLICRPRYPVLGVILLGVLGFFTVWNPFPNASETASHNNQEASTLSAPIHQSSMGSRHGSAGGLVPVQTESTHVASVKANLKPDAQYSSNGQ